MRPGGVLALGAIPHENRGTRPAAGIAMRAGLLPRCLAMQYLETAPNLWAHENVYSFLAYPRNGARPNLEDPLLDTRGVVIGRVKDVLDGAVRLQLQRTGRADAWALRGRVLRGELWLVQERQTIRLLPAKDREQFLRAAADELAAKRAPRSSADRLVPADVSASDAGTGSCRVGAGAPGLLPFARD